MSKSKSALLSIGQPNNIFTHTYKIKDTDISIEQKMRELGVTIDDKLTMSQHVSNLVSKARIRANLIFKCFHSRDRYTLLRALITYAMPLLEYASQVRSPLTAADIANVESVHYESVRGPSVSWNLDFYFRNLHFYSRNQDFYFWNVDFYFWILDFVFRNLQFLFFEFYILDFWSVNISIFEIYIDFYFWILNSVFRNLHRATNDWLLCALRMAVFIMFHFYFRDCQSISAAMVKSKFPVIPKREFPVALLLSVPIGPIQLTCSFHSINKGSGVFTTGPLGPCPPLQKNATKMRHFQAKISKIFWGGGIGKSNRRLQFCQ